MLSKKEVEQSSTISRDIDVQTMGKITEVSKLTASDAVSNDEFGKSMSMSEDGLTLVVGAPNKDANGLTDSGQVYTYTRHTVNDSWIELSRLTASDAGSYDYFGVATFVSSDGLTLIVGAPNKSINDLESNGQIYTYTRDTVNDEWVEVSKLTASDAVESDAFGYSMSLSRDSLTLVVNAICKDTNGLNDNGQIYTYVRANTNDTWTEVSKLTASDAVSQNYFGYPMSMSEDGLVLIVGTSEKSINGLSNNGQVYTYVRANTNDTWAEVSKLTASDATAGDCFGHFVGISSDGLILVVGAPLKDVNGLTQTGQVYTYIRPTVNDSWTEVSKLITTDDARHAVFGTSLSLSNNGLNLIVNAPYKDSKETSQGGRVCVYTRDTANDNWSEVSKLTISDAVNKDYIDMSLITANNGSTLVVGLPFKGIDGLENNGQVYTYTRPSVNDM